MWSANSRSMRLGKVNKVLASSSVWIIVCAVIPLVTSCGLNQKGMVLMTDPTYKASVIATDHDGLTVPDGLLWHQGRFYVADEGGSALRIWNGPGHVTTLCDSSIGVKSPEDLVIDKAGNVFFTDDDAGGVWTVNNFGEASRLAGPEKGLGSTEGIALSPDGSLLVGEGETHKIFAVTTTGAVSEFLGSNAGIRKPETMTYDERGNLYIGDNDDNVLYMRTSDGKLHRMIEGREGFSPESLWYSNGVLYITDSHDGKLFQYTPEDGLRVLAVFGGDLHAVNGVTTDDHGAIYVSVQTDLARKIGYLIKIEHQNN